jgi:DNA-binding MarR family transcriptional regulator
LPVQDPASSRRETTAAVRGVSRARLNHTSVDQSTGYLVRKTFRAFTRSLEHRLKAHGISISMWFFLRLLWEKDGVTQKYLSDELGLMQPTTVTAVDNMEKAGYVERRRNGNDRRKVNIFLTRKGWALREKVLPYAREVNTIALQGIADEDVTRMWDVLQRMNHSLNDDHERMTQAKRRSRRMRD